MSGGKARRAAQYSLYRTPPAVISGATLWDLLIFSQDIFSREIVAPRSCKPGYTSLTAPHPEKKLPTVAATVKYEIGSRNIPQYPRRFMYNKFPKEHAIRN